MSRSGTIIVIAVAAKTDVAATVVADMILLLLAFVVFLLLPLISHGGYERDMRAVRISSVLSLRVE